MPTLFASGEMADAIALIKQFGPFFLAVVFFLWRDWRREDRLSNRLDSWRTSSGRSSCRWSRIARSSLPRIRR